MKQKKPVKPVNVRFDEDTYSRLAAVSDSSGIDISTLIRIACGKLLTDVEQGGELKVPVNSITVSGGEQVAMFGSSIINGEPGETPEGPKRPGKKTGHRKR